MDEAHLPMLAEERAAEDMLLARLVPAQLTESLASLTTGPGQDSDVAEEENLPSRVIPWSCPAM